MTRAEAEEYAKEMTYRDAINNLMKARSIPYRKATFIKVNELLKALEQEPCEDCINRAEALKNLALTNGKDDVYRMINSLPSIQPKPKTDVLDKIRAEIKEWYWQADKQALAKDACVVDAMVDLFIRTIDKYKAEKE
jgi:hypothetical protein